MSRTFCFNSILAIILSGQAVVIPGVDKTKEAEEILKQNWVRTLGQETYSI